MIRYVNDKELCNLQPKSNPFRDDLQSGETITMPISEQHDLVHHVNNLTSPGVYVKHMTFTNFSSFGLPKPIYFNIVRDPVDTVISFFNYNRDPDHIKESKINR